MDRRVFGDQQSFEGPDWPALLVIGSLILIWMTFLAVTAVRLLAA